MSATIDRDELDAWMRERDLMLISNEHYADLTRQLARARHSATVTRTEADQLRAELATDRLVIELLQRQAIHCPQCGATVRAELDVPPG